MLIRSSSVMLQSEATYLRRVQRGQLMEATIRLWISHKTLRDSIRKEVHYTSIRLMSWTGMNTSLIMWNIQLILPQCNSCCSLLVSHLPIMGWQLLPSFVPSTSSQMQCGRANRLMVVAFYAFSSPGIFAAPILLSYFVSSSETGGGIMVS